ncbi:MAG: methyltransferase [Defluviitaleaceae bacterium]|nr:methyltransferase [Defluviitaleaceae bacterium]
MSKPKKFFYVYGDNEYVFFTDSGIFSKSGMDANTDILLRSLAKEKPAGKFLDLGCGYGCVGIVLAKAFCLDVTQVDINPAAVALTIKNSLANNVKTKAVVSDGYSNIADFFDAIALNPPIHAGKTAVHSLYSGSYDHLKDGGLFYVVINKKHGAESTKEKLIQVFANCESIYKKNGIRVFKCKK